MTYFGTQVQDIHTVLPSDTETCSECSTAATSRWGGPTASWERELLLPARSRPGNIGTQNPAGEPQRYRKHSREQNGPRTHGGPSETFFLELGVFTIDRLLRIQSTELNES